MKKGFKDYFFRFHLFWLSAPGTSRHCWRSESFFSFHFVFVSFSFIALQRSLNFVTICGQFTRHMWGAIYNPGDYETRRLCAQVALNPTERNCFSTPLPVRELLWESAIYCRYTYIISIRRMRKLLFYSKFFAEARLSWVYSVIGSILNNTIIQ